MIILKSVEEIAKMRHAGRIVAGTIDRVLEAVRPGIATAELDRVAEQYIGEANAKPSFKGYRGFPASICACSSIAQDRSRYESLSRILW